MKTLAIMMVLLVLVSCSHAKRKHRSQSSEREAVTVSVPVPVSETVSANGNTRIATFEEAKRLAREIHEENPYTLYCHCRFEKKRVDLESCHYVPRRDYKRASRIEWEHVVPAHAFGQSFREWREGAPGCRRKGRACAKSNPEFAHMEADLYNLWPEVGELNGLRSNFSMSELPGDDGNFGGCRAKVRDRKFEPMDFAKGIVARTYMYMEQNYPGHGIMSNKNEKLFHAWDRLYPVSDWECRRALKIEAIQGNENQVLKSRCSR